MCYPHDFHVHYILHTIFCYIFSQEFKVQCFGGDYTGEVYDHVLKKSVVGFSHIYFFGLHLDPFTSLVLCMYTYMCMLYKAYTCTCTYTCVCYIYVCLYICRTHYRRQKRWWSAYLLFYDRADQSPVFDGELIKAFIMHVIWNVVHMYVHVCEYSHVHVCSTAYA